MQILNPQLDLDAFFRALHAAAPRLLLLDYDGTLAPFHPDRFQARPYPQVAELLQAIIDGGRTRLVIISGRALADLRPMLPLDPMPELWGAHGWERQLPDGTAEQAAPEREVGAALERAAAAVAALGLAKRSERKTASVTVHWRGLPAEDAAAIRQAAAQRWQPLAIPEKLALHTFDGGLELRALGRDKGVAVRTILAEQPGNFASAACFGDDATDEDAFLALRGHGVSFLVQPKFRPTAADVWIAPPAELVAVLGQWVGER